MLINLLKFELLKKWKSIRYVLLAYALIEIVILLSCRLFFWKNNEPHLFTIKDGSNVHLNGFITFAVILFFALSILLSLYPFVEGIRRYEKDLSGKQAALELMIPAHSWKKVTAKLISTVINTIICGISIVFAILVFTLVATNFDQSVTDSILQALTEMISSPIRIIYTILSTFFIFASIYLLFYFCIAISKAISNKNKISTLISIAVFVGSVALLSYLSFLTEKFPIYSFKIYDTQSSLASLILNILSFAVTFAGSVWLMEHKIEN
ncbi:hypothetical protein JHL18_13335 [Clostridium sp. YIM B02505]|uniref:ABC transporter permease n=1 Tax=Clostridium yunnanense TaxID=2800325 RepID=A0ABS1EQH1_9CLOT|nr:hypothetical protein [Clostridium yunnanense]MBK1811602.1 hypothetical protein [Clostridium yunnanense]